MPQLVIKNPMNQSPIKKAQGIAEKAVSLFQSTLQELYRSNDILKEHIGQSEAQIKEHQLNIQEAMISMGSNNAIISKLQDFVH